MKRSLALVAALGAAGCAPDDSARDRQLLVITIDTEALPSRAATDPVQRLIYGDFGDGQRAGIDEMMDAADRHGVKLSFFLDVLEELLYPGEIAEVAHHIVARGHDVELHTHPEKMPAEAWARLGFDGEKLANEFTRDDAAAILGEAERIMADWDIPSPIAYRAGGYLYSAGTVQALPDFGFRYDYDYNLLASSQVDHNAGELPVFTWENGLVEVPISYIDHDGKPDRFDDFTYLDGGNGLAYGDIRTFQDAPGDNVLVMMMHSWSFLDLVDDDHFFDYDGDWRRADFDRFLDHLPDFVDVVTARALDDRIDELTIDTTERTDDLF